MKKVLLIVIVMLSCGCDNKHPVDKLPGGFNELRRPVVIVACNEGGLIVMDSNQDIYVWNSSYYFVEPFIKSDLQKGDVLLPKRAGEQ
jgi:hypothetical protein